MEKIASFQVNHLTLVPGVCVAATKLEVKH